jgi:hypothetical protein
MKKRVYQLTVRSETQEIRDEEAREPWRFPEIVRDEGTSCAFLEEIEAAKCDDSENYADVCIRIPVSRGALSESKDEQAATSSSKAGTCEVELAP